MDAIYYWFISIHYVSACVWINIEILKYWKQYTEIVQTNSYIWLITIGVPQVSVLGPLLYIIYVNDFIHANQLIVNVALYADDTALYTSLNVLRKTTLNNKSL